ncbi:MAG: hypothetical protein NTU61_01685, partial [Candidatus Altiarchaeota archaeon]|nr:hypothetical protein [Candidatus Altiarchaeota archaeon]
MAQKHVHGSKQGDLSNPAELDNERLKSIVLEFNRFHRTEIIDRVRGLIDERGGATVRVLDLGGASDAALMRAVKAMFGGKVDVLCVDPED